ncbi:MAG TPA: gamma carbonic anhydrase family protein [Fibrobacteraceae bacterium]|nr:gamma carbonic anhydrase family protein [Fibrobacteraceae bacterium]
MSIQTGLYPYCGHLPKIGARVLLAPGACVIGRVTLADDVSVFPNAVLRGDINTIVIGARTNIQDNVTIHLADKFGVVVGAGVTIGHNAVVHACTIEDGCTIGMGAIVMDGAIIRKNSIVAAGALVTGGSEFPEGSLILGTPAKLKRALTPEEVAGTISMAAKYVHVKDELLQSLRQT